MDADYLEPSPQSRRRLILILLTALVVGLVAIDSFETYVDRAKTLPLCEQATALHWMWTAACLALAGLGIWVGWLARRSLKSKQWPLPGTWVFRRTPIHRGASAKWRAYFLLGWAVILMAGSAWSWYVVESYIARVQSHRCVIHDHS